MWMIEGHRRRHSAVVALTSAAYHEDRRMYRTAEPVMRWCKANEQYLVDRQPVATVGVGLVAAEHRILRARRGR